MFHNKILFKRGREEARGETFPPSPSLKGRGCLLVEMTLCGLAGVLGREGSGTLSFRRRVPERSEW